MVKASYIDSLSSKTTVKQGGAWKRITAGIFLVFFTLITLLGAGLSQSAAFAQTEEDVDKKPPFSLTKWMLCRWGEDSLAYMIYQKSQSDDIEFTFFSKSSIGVPADDVEIGPWGMNWMLDLSKGEFKKTNEAILGRDLNPFEKKEAVETDEPKEEKPTEFNGGRKVNPFERFGVAGLNYTGYSGEWKYLLVRPCQEVEVVDPKAAMFYEDRLTPRSTWADKNRSIDVRTKQHNLTIVTHYWISVGNTLSNLIFNITKLIVTLTLSLINFAFSDTVKILGLDRFIGGDTPEDGVFGMLYEGFFTPLIVIAFALTGMNILWHGIVKRQYRMGYTILFRSIGLFFAAIIISAQPLFWISLPNNFAVVVQSVMISSLNTGITGGSGLCTTGVAAKETKLTEGSNKNDDLSILDQASKNMRASIGCAFWQEFLFRPWAQGQFGVDWNQTWAKGKVPDWAEKSTAAALANDDRNAKMVGDADVPMGGGELVHNWALFQLSTQTNAHAALGQENKPGKYTSGIANDWWRIADVMSNYTETEAVEKGAGNDGQDVSYPIPDATVPPLKEWGQWNGNSPINRIFTSVFSIIVALLGVIAPLFFAFLSTVYTIGVAILMAFLPVFLLFACWAGKGWEMFKGYAELVANTVARRIAVGLLLVVSIMFVSTAIQIMEKESWWEGIIMMILLSFVLIRSRSKIIDGMASLRFASVNFQNSANKTVKSLTAPARLTGKLAVMGAAGGIAGKRANGAFISGAVSGVKTEIRQRTYRSDLLRQASYTYDERNANRALKDGSRRLDEFVCFSCGDPLDSGSIVYAMGAQYYCEDCAHTDGRFEEMNQITIPSFDEKLEKEIDEKSREKIESEFQGDDYVEAIHEVTKRESEPDKVDTDQKLESFRTVAHLTGKEISNIEARQRAGYKVIYPDAPPQIALHINQALLNEAWESRNYDYVRRVYAAAWTTWYVTNVAVVIEESVDDLMKTFIDTMEYGPETAHSDPEEEEDPKRNNP